MEETIQEIEYNVQGIIELEPSFTLEFEQKICYQSPDNVQVEIISTDVPERISFLARIHTNDPQEAKARAELELDRVSKLLVWLQATKVKRARIESLQYSPAAEKRSVTILAATLRLQSNVTVKLRKALCSDSSRALGSALSQKYTEEFEDVLSSWYQAQQQQSEIAQYIILYRLLDRLLQGRQNLDKWIQSAEPTTLMIPNRSKNSVTIFTYLRDNVHSKTEQKEYPVAKIIQYLPQLEGLVQRAIKEVLVST